MDLSYTPEQEAFRTEVRNWFEKNVERGWGETQRDPSLDSDALVQIRRDFQAKMNEAGYLGMDWPEEWGGRGATVVEKNILSQEMVRADAPPIANSLGLMLLGPALIHHGSEEQRRRFRITEIRELF